MLSFLKKIFSPKNVVTIQDVFGPSYNGVHSQGAMGQPAVYACVRLLSTVIASLPIDIREKESGKKIDNNLSRLLSISTNKFLTSFEWRDMTMTSNLLTGVGYGRLYRNNAGEVIAIIPLHPEYVQPIFDASRQDIKYVISYYEGLVARSETVWSENMFVLRGQFSDLTTPISPIAAQARNIATSEVMQSHKYNFFGPNAAKPGGIIESEGKIDPEVAKRILKLFNARYAGSENSGKTIFLEDSLKYKVLQVTNTDAQFLELCKFSLEDVCRIYNVPPSLIHQTENTSFATASQQALSFLKFTLVPLLEAFEQAITRDIFSEADKEKYYVNFNTANLLRGDNEQVANYIVKLVQGGCMTPNEGREFIGLPKMPGKASNQLYIQQNQISVDQLDARNKESENNTNNNKNNATLNAEDTFKDLLNFEKNIINYLGDKDV